MVRHSVTPNVDTFGVLNEAIRYVAKELFLLRSSILRADLSVSIWAEVTSVGDDIAFVDSDPDTITSVTTDFDDDGFVSGMHIISSYATNPGPFKLNTVAANLLTLISADELTAKAAGTEYTLTSNDDYGDLPADFWGLEGHPYLDGRPDRLYALPSLNARLQYTSAGLPIYYEIKGRRICVTPATSADYTIKGKYFARPTAITAASDTLPFDEIFDDIFAEYMRIYFLQAGSKGKMVPSAALRNDVLDLACRYGMQAPTLLSNEMRWEDYF